MKLSREGDIDTEALVNLVEAAYTDLKIPLESEWAVRPALAANPVSPRHGNAGPLGGSIETKAFYLLVADSILVVHALFALFVVLGLVLILVGKLFSWRWVRNPWFRVVHLLGIGVVIVQSWIGVLCPLTVWENAMRSKAGDITYEGSFIAHWLNRLLYYEAPWWVFVVCYTVFGGMVLASWIFVRPRAFSAGSSASTMAKV